MAKRPHHSFGTPLPGIPTPESLDERSATFGAVRRLDPVLQIRSRMRELGVSSADLADRMGVSEANVSRLLKGDQNLKIDTLYRLADALNVPLTLTIEAPAVTLTSKAQAHPTAVADDKNVGSVPNRPRPSRRHHARRTLEP